MVQLYRQALKMGSESGKMGFFLYFQKDFFEDWLYFLNNLEK